MWFRSCLCVLVLGCGGPDQVPHATPDGGTSDAADTTDALPPVMGTIRVTIVQGSTTNPLPVAGEKVVFSDLTQTQIVTTDSSGVASATVVGKTTVSYVREYTPNLLGASSILAAMPGDDLTLEQLSLDYTQRAPLTVSFTLSGAFSYSVCGPCGCTTPNSSPVSLPMAEWCQKTPASITFIAHQSGGACSYSTAVATYDASTGGSVTMPSSLVSCTQYAGSFSNIGAPVTALFLDFVGGASSRVAFNNPAASVTGQVAGWGGQPARFSTSFLDANGPGSFQFSNEDISSTTTGISLDVGNWLLPWLGQPAFDPASQKFSVPIVATGTPGDLYVASFDYGPQSGGSVLWTVFAETPDDFVLPQIPTAVADLAPSTNVGNAYAFVVASESVSGYADARRNPYRLWKSARVPGSGTIRMSMSPNAQNP